MLAKTPAQRDTHGVRRFKAIPKTSGHTAVVRYDDGFFTFTVVDAANRLLWDDDGSRSEAGADHELPDLGRLMDRSKPWIDWSTNADLARRLHHIALEDFSAETQRVLARVW